MAGRLAYPQARVRVRRAIVREDNGVETRATLAVRFTGGRWHDSQELPVLVKAVPDDVSVDAALGDKADWTRDNCQTAKGAGLQPYFQPKANARWWKFPSDVFGR